MVNSRRQGWDFARIILPLLILCLITACTGLAQENSGEISGTVTDESGAVVPGAKLTATSPTLPRGLAATTDALGKYTFLRVPIGVYAVSVTKEGFSTVRQYNVDVSLGSKITYNAKLAVGQVTGMSHA